MATVTIKIMLTESDIIDLVAEKYNLSKETVSIRHSIGEDFRGEKTGITIHAEGKQKPNPFTSGKV